MALTPFKTFAAGEILTASDLNSSFSTITTNALSLISPLTGTLDADGQIIILDSDADSNIRCATDDVLTLTLQGFASFLFDGDVVSPVNGITLTSAATTAPPTITAHGETNVSLALAAKGTGDIQVRAGTAETDILLVAAGSVADVALRLQGKGTSKVQLGDANLQWPDADGTANHYLRTNGAGVLSFANPVEFVTGGTVGIVFYMAAAPTGWTKASAAGLNDAGLRVVTGGTGGTTGGTNAFSTVMAQTVVGGTTLSAAQSGVPAHIHNVGILTAATLAAGVRVAQATTGNESTLNVNSDANATAAAGSSHNHTITLSMKFADVIVCTKD